MSNQRAGNVPQNVVQTNYVPQVPHMWYSCGTKLSSTLDGDKFTDFWVDLLKILFLGKFDIFIVWIFLEGWGGPKPKNIYINVTFS